MLYYLFDVILKRCYELVIFIVIIIIIKYICKALDRSATKALKVSRWCRTGTLSVVLDLLLKLGYYLLQLLAQLQQRNIGQC